MAIRILYAEDNGVTRAATAAFLEKAGFEVTQVRSGRGALELVNDGATFEAYLIDIGLRSKPDGIEVAESIRSRGKGQDAVIICPTGIPEGMDVRTAGKKLGCHFLDKPLDKKALVALLGRLLSDRLE